MAKTKLKTPLLAKLGIQPNDRIDIINPPENYYSLLGEMPADIFQHTSEAEMDFIQIFATDRNKLAVDFLKAKARLKMDGMLWVCWPKQISPQSTELRDSVVRELGLGHGMVDVKVVAVDKTWSGLKFVYRKEDRKSPA